jgi:hypothetical protein
MNINHVTNAKRVGQIGISATHAKKLTFIADSSITRDELRDDTGRVYFITINGEIKKIGGSQCKGGIQSTIGAYLGGFAQGMCPRSYCGWNFLRQHVVAGDLVEFWFILAPTITATIPTMNGSIQQQIAVDFHQIETACVQEYLEVEKDYPVLNMQESGRKWRDMSGPSGRLLEGYPGIIDTGA